MLRDGLAMAADGVNKIIETTEPKEEPKAEKPTREEINSQKWTDKTSDKGAYQTTNKTDNSNSAAFQKLQKYLKDNNGFAILHGFKLWQFSNNPDILARRKK